MYPDGGRAVPLFKWGLEFFTGYCAHVLTFDGSNPVIFLNQELFLKIQPEIAVVC